MTFLRPQRVVQAILVSGLGAAAYYGYSRLQEFSKFPICYYRTGSGGTGLVCRDLKKERENNPDPSDNF